MSGWSLKLVPLVRIYLTCCTEVCCGNFVLRAWWLETWLEGVNLHCWFYILGQRKEKSWRCPLQTASSPGEHSRSDIRMKIHCWYCCVYVNSTRYKVAPIIAISLWEFRNSRVLHSEAAFLTLLTQMKRQLTKVTLVFISVDRQYTYFMSAQLLKIYTSKILLTKNNFSFARQY